MTIRHMNTRALQVSTRATTMASLVLASIAVVLGLIAAGRMWPPPAIRSGPTHSMRADPLLHEDLPSGIESAP